MRILLPDGWIDGDTGEVHRGGDGKLRAKELALVRYLAERPGVTIGRGELYELVWGYHPDTRSRTVDTTVRRVREVVEVDPAEPAAFVTDPGVGYRYVAPRGDHDGAAAHVAAGVRGIAAGERVALWGPPGVGRSHWLRATGLPGVDDAPGPTGGLCTLPARPRVPGVRAVEVTPLPEDAGRALVARRLRELGSSVAVPDDLSAYDGLPAALLAAADRADLYGEFVEPGPDDPLQQRYAALAEGDGALGAVASFGVEVPTDVVAQVVGEDALRRWVDRGLVRRGGTALRVLAHVRRAAVADREVTAALSGRAAAAFRAVHDPDTGMCTTSAGLARARALAPLVDDPALRVRRAACLGLPVPEPAGAEELASWVLGLHAPPTEHDLAAVPHPVARAAASATLRYRLEPRATTPTEPPADDRSVAAVYWLVAVAFGHSARGDYEQARRCFSDALARAGGHDLLEARIGCRLAHTLAYLGRVDEAAAAFAGLPRVDAAETFEILMGASAVAALRHDVPGAVAAARAARDVLPRLPVRAAVSAGARLARLFRGAGDLDAAVASALGAMASLRSASPGPVVEGDLAFALGSSLVERGDPAGGRVQLLRALALGGGRLPHRDAFAHLFLAFAAQAERRPDHAREHAGRALEGAGADDSRVCRLVRVAVFPWFPPDAEALRSELAYADRTFDPELRAVVALAEGRTGAPEVGAERPLSSVVRLLLPLSGDRRGASGA